MNVSCEGQYVGAEDVLQYLKIDYNQNDIDYLNNLIIPSVCDMIDSLAGTAWRKCSVTNENHRMAYPRSFSFYLMSRPVYLKYYPITKINKLEVWMAGSCVVGNTLIYTPIGAKYIKDLKVGDYIYSMDGNNIVVDRVKHVWKSGVKKVYKVEVKGGNYVIASDNHPFLVVRKVRGKRDAKGRFMDKYYLEWVQLKDLKVGDVVLTVYDNRFSNVNVDITREEMRFYGFWLGDGNTRKYKVYLWPFDENDWKYYHKIIENAFGKSAGLVKDKNKKGGDWAGLVIYSKDVVDRMKELGFVGHAHTKRVPDWAFSLPKEYIVELIEGYVDADGWRIKDNYYSVASVNKDLLYDIKLLASLVGYQTSEIKLQERKNAFGKYIYRMFINTNPYKKPNDFYAVKLLEEYSRNFSFRKIKRIEYVGEEMTYDVEVENHHNFIGNGFVLHNSYQDWTSATDGNDRLARWWAVWEEGVIWINWMFWYGGRYDVRISYDFGVYEENDDGSIIPKPNGHVKMLAMLWSAYQFLDSERYSSRVADGIADANTYQQQMQRLKRQIDELKDWIKGYKVVVGGQI